MTNWKRWLLALITLILAVSAGTKDLAASAESAAPDSPEAIALTQKWQNVITRNFYECTDEILLGLASMYESDDRFRENIDKAGPGTATFITAAIRALCSGCSRPISL